MDQLTEFSLRHMTGGRPAVLTVDQTGKIVKVAGIPDLRWAISVAGFTADGLDAGPDLDVSARYALAHDPQLTVGLTPVIDTADGRTILLYTVVHAGPRTADRDALIGDQDLWDVSAYDPAGAGLISSRALVGVGDRIRIVDAIRTRLGAVEFAAFAGTRDGKVLPDAIRAKLGRNILRGSGQTNETQEN